MGDDAVAAHPANTTTHQIPYHLPATFIVLSSRIRANSAP
jgi:hypothetical protein